MPSLIPFQFESREIRVVVIDNQPFFSARDVALALEYADPSQAYNLHCKSLKKLSSVECTELKWENPNPRGEYVMPQSDVLRLIVKSSKPEAEKFEKWVFEDVLPSILKTGSYSIPKTAPAPAPKLTTAERDRLLLAREVFKTAKLFGFDANMAILSADCYVRKIMGGGVLENMGATHLLADPRGQVYTPTELGRMLEPQLSAVKMNLELELAGLQKREFGGWLPTDNAEGLFEWSDTGKRHGTGAPVKQLRWFKQVLSRIPTQKAA